MRPALFLRRSLLPRLRLPLGVLVALAYLLANVGFPLPARLTSKPSQVPFPCQHRACGCMSAEQCAQGCCCLSRDQRRAWHVARGLEIPAVLVDAAVPTPAPRACCQQVRSCCESKSTTPTEPSVEFVLANHWRMCHGLLPLWMTIGAGLPELPRVNAAFEISCVWESRLLSESALSSDLLPPVPPPRRAA